MMKKNTHKKKIQKNVELVSLLTSFFDSEMDYGDRLAPTPLAKSIILKNKSHPHFNTVHAKLWEAKLWKEILQSIEIKTNKKGDRITFVEKIEQKKDNFKQEIRNDISEIKNIQDLILSEIKKLKKK